MGQYDQILNRLRASFASGKTKCYEWRISQLTALYNMIEENKEKFGVAVLKDLHRPKLEALLLDTQICTNEIVDAVNNLSQWMKPEKVKKGSIYMLDSMYIKKEPLGVVLVIGTWNYPFQNTLMPLTSAIAAGNCAIVKPSEVSEHCANLLKELIPKYLDQDCVQIVTGGVPEITALLEEKFDKIIYTGNGTVGRIIMSAAAKHLTPVILELGGKSPAYVDKDVDIKLTAKRLAWGKFTNSGQTCVAPDYVLCRAEEQEPLIKEIKSALEEFYGDDVQKSDSYGRIISTKHFARLQKLKQGANIAIGGQEDETERFMAPTVLRDVKLSDPIMQEEIFGPLLPIIIVKDHKEAIDIINQRDKPLAMYVFCTKGDVSKDFLHNTSSGAFLLNDVMVHAGVPTLPFGGVGASGMGSTHGKFSFDEFSHHRAVMERPLYLDQVNFIRYPPYSEKKISMIHWILGKTLKKSGAMAFLPFMVLGAVIAIVFKMM